LYVYLLFTFYLNVFSVPFKVRWVQETMEVFFKVFLLLNEIVFISHVCLYIALFFVSD
jgi:hypothetical protein